MGVCWLGTQNLNACFVKPTLHNIFSYILFNVFDWPIKHNLEKKFKTFFLFFMRLSSQGRLYKTRFVSFRVLFSSGNKNFMQKRGEISFNRKKVVSYPKIMKNRVSDFRIFKDLWHTRKSQIFINVIVRLFQLNRWNHRTF